MRKNLIKTISILRRACWKLGLSPVKLNAIEHRLNKNHIRRIVGKCTIGGDMALSPMEAHSPVWVMWMQGKENMPEINRICYNSLLRNIGDHSMMFIDTSNLPIITSSDCELSWNTAIDSALNDGRINAMHYSDFLRVWLLYNFGGIWSDSTLFYCDKIDNFIQDRYFYSAKHITGPEYNQFPVEGLVSSYFICSAKGHPLFKFVYESMLAILNEEKCIKLYFTLDYLLKIAIESNPWLRKQIDSWVIINNRISQAPLERPYSSKLFNDFKAASPFYKLTYKIKYPEETQLGQQTLYGYLKENLG